ncbi:transporter substrate-binding domain-containing protein [Variovorax sp. RCC_210]|uniref:transporter substrate-binding domain-containing protein n=1 Tax=Variovorax sp. RCC_210 TaxID=3239217 RepID=UPI003526304B
MKFMQLLRAFGAMAAVLSSAAPLLAHADKLDDVLKRGYLIVGTTSATPPFGWKDEKGELRGFDVDLSRLIAKALFGDPNKIKFELVSNDTRWPALQNDQVDMLAHSATITPSRLVRVGFTPRYFDTGITVVIKSDSKIKTLADLNNPAVTIATLTVPEQIDLVKRMAPKATVSSFGSVDQQSLALRSGRVQALFVDLPIGMWYAATNPDLKVVPEVYGGYQNYGLAYKLGELRWKQFLDGFVTDLTTGYSYIEYSAIYKKYFKMDPPPQRSYKIPGAA